MQAFNEYENRIVPKNKRLSTRTIAAIWVSLPLTITGGVIGGLLVLSMGFIKAFWAILIGNTIQYLYASLLGMIGTQRGMSFALQCGVTYGQKGFRVIAIFIATSLLGWIAVENGILAKFMNEGFGISYQLIAVIAGLLFLLISYFGIKGIYWISVLSAPLYLLACIYVIYDIFIDQAFVRIAHFNVPPGTASMSMGVGISIVFAAIVNGTIVNADFCRWAKKPIDAWIASLAGLPFGNSLAMLMGGIIIAAYSQEGSTLFKDINMFTILLHKNNFLTIFAVIFLFCNMGSVCVHALYNIATAYSHVFNTHYRVVLIILSMISILVAVSGIWQYLTDWLSIVGIAIPPIGAVIIADQLIVGNLTSNVNYHLSAFIAIFIGVIVAILSNHFLKGQYTALFGMLASILSYLLVVNFWKNKTTSE